MKEHCNNDRNMKVSNIIGTYIDRKEGWKTINKLHVV